MDRKRRRSTKRKSDIYELIDFWSIPHFLFGVVTALLAVVFSIPSGPMFILTLIGAMLWEWFESRNGIKETLRNRISDILFPLISFPVTYLYARYAVDEPEHRRALLAIVSIVFFYVNFMAWKARFEHDGDFSD